MKKKEDIYIIYINLCRVALTALYEEKINSYMWQGWDDACAKRGIFVKAHEDHGRLKVQVTIYEDK